MSTEQFPVKLADEVKYYVYRLIDPRNGQTFYVGKGKRNRVFMHAQGLNTTLMTTGRDQRRRELRRSTLRDFPLVT